MYTTLFFLFVLQFGLHYSNYGHFATEVFKLFIRILRIFSHFWLLSFTKISIFDGMFLI